MKHYKSFAARLLGCAVLLLSAACAQPLTFSSKSPAVWLEPHLEGLALLREDGRVVYWNGDATEVLANGVAGDSVVSCGAALYGVETDGDLLNITTGTRGVKVAQHSRPVCLPDSSLVVLSDTANELLRVNDKLEVQARASVNALPDAELVTTDLKGNGRPDVVVLTKPSTRYPHGVLGDELEAEGVAVFDAGTLKFIASTSFAVAFVYEQRRVLPVTYRDDTGASKQGILTTRSSSDSGAAVELLALEGGKLERVAAADAIGTGFRWLNLFAARDGVAYAVRTPHIGGPLQRYQVAEGLTTESFQLGVTNHIYGSRNLDLGVLLDTEGADTLAITLNSHDGVRLIHCAESCEASETFMADARINSNVTQFSRDAETYVAFADTAGKVYLIPVSD